MMVAQAQQQESQANVAKKAAELNLKRQEMLLTDARERYRIETQNTVAVAGLQLKYGADMHKVQAQLEHEKAQNVLEAGLNQLTQPQAKGFDAA